VNEFKLFAEDVLESALSPKSLARLFRDLTSSASKSTFTLLDFINFMDVVSEPFTPVHTTTATHSSSSFTPPASEKSTANSAKPSEFSQLLQQRGQPQPAVEASNKHATATATATAAAAAAFAVNDEVEGQYDGGNFWYRGKIARVSSDGTCDIEYDDGERENSVSAAKIRRIAAPSASVFSVDDKVEGNYRGQGKWYPGKIGRVNNDGSCDIEYDDSEREAGVDARYIRVAAAVPATAPARAGARAENREHYKGEGNYRAKGKWYPGTIYMNSDGTIDIMYDDGEEERTRVPNMARRLDAAAVPAPTPASTSAPAPNITGIHMPLTRAQPPAQTLSPPQHATAPGAAPVFATELEDDAVFASSLGGDALGDMGLGAAPVDDVPEVDFDAPLEDEEDEEYMGDNVDAAPVSSRIATARDEVLSVSAPSVPSVPVSARSAVTQQSALYGDDFDE